jgi:hypothetical protein
MAFKLKITNVSHLPPRSRARNIFLIEAGKLLGPGDFAFANRMDRGTESLVEINELAVEEGVFDATVPLPPKPRAAAQDDDDDTKPPPRAKPREFELQPDGSGVAVPEENNEKVFSADTPLPTAPRESLGTAAAVSASEMLDDAGGKASPVTASDIGGEEKVFSASDKLPPSPAMSRKGSTAKSSPQKGS